MQHIGFLHYYDIKKSHELHQAMTIVTYQILISLTIIFSGIFAGEKMLTTITEGWAVWTLTHVFIPWLMFLQFATIGLSWLIASSYIKGGSSE